MAGNSSFPFKGPQSGKQTGFAMSSGVPGSIGYSVAGVGTTRSTMLPPVAPKPHLPKTPVE